jgi:hypothetical protein
LEGVSRFQNCTITNTHGQGTLALCNDLFDLHGRKRYNITNCTFSFKPHSNQSCYGGIADTNTPAVPQEFFEELRETNFEIKLSQLDDYDDDDDYDVCSECGQIH